jgi:hypothetical protein
VPKDDPQFDSPDTARLAAQLMHGRSPDEMRAPVGSLLNKELSRSFEEFRRPQPKLGRVPMTVRSFRVRLDLLGTRSPRVVIIADARRTTGLAADRTETTADPG